MHLMCMLDHIQYLEDVHIIHHLVMKEIPKLVSSPSRLRVPILHHWSHR